jgi:peroxin-1
VIVRCNELVGEQAGSIRNVLHDAISEALDHAPALIILDDLDALLPKEEGPEPATVVMALAEFLGDLMDLYQVGFPLLLRTYKSSFVQK